MEISVLQCKDVSEVLVKVDEILKQNDSIALFFVELEDQEGNMYRFQWIVEKVNNQGVFENCWMTTSVSQPMLLEKSV